MKRSLVAILLALTLLFSGGVAVHAKAKTATPLYVECSSVTWASKAHATTSGGNLSLTVYLQAEEDAHDLAWCGLVRSRVDWSQTTPSQCATYYSGVVSGTDVIYSERSTSSCYLYGTIYSGTWAPSGTTIVEGFGCDNLGRVPGADSGWWVLP